MPRDAGAVEYLLGTLRSVTEPLTVVAVGPLSNMATTDAFARQAPAGEHA